jgi:hypothetical protein
MVEYEQYEALLAQSEKPPPSEPDCLVNVATDRETGVAITVHITAEEARRLVNREVVPELGTGLGAKNLICCSGANRLSGACQSCCHWPNWVS